MWLCFHIKRILSLSNSEGFQFPLIQTFTPRIFWFCNANIHGEVRCNDGFAICMQKSCRHFAHPTLNLTLGQQTCLYMDLSINGTYQKKVNEYDFFFPMLVLKQEWYLHGEESPKSLGWTYKFHYCNLVTVPNHNTQIEVKTLH